MSTTWRVQLIAVFVVLSFMSAAAGLRVRSAPALEHQAVIFRTLSSVSVLAAFGAILVGIGPHHFSLRTVMITITLAAIVLGVIVAVV